MYDYFYGAEAEQFSFYRIPKVLFTEERFRSVSAEAKVLYGLLLDRMSLSCKNGWLDKEGRVYIIFTIEEVMTALGCADQKAGKLLHELENKCRLIERKRQGLGKPNLIYVKNFVDTQYKTGKPLSIPLSAEIGEAIIAYLKYGRPSSEESAIFLSHNAPFQPLNHHNNFNSEIRKYMRLAGIDFTAKRHSGVHTLRSSFATNMLKQGASLDNISQILGHSDINVATSYLRVDPEHLRLCALGLGVVK